MRLIGTLGAFLAALFVTWFFVAIGLNRALEDPDAELLRWSAWLFILVVSALSGWWGWTVLGRRAAPGPATTSPSFGRKTVTDREVEAARADRLRRISGRGRQDVADLAVDAETPAAAPRHSAATRTPPT
jgi:hypothetical protein